MVCQAERSDPSLSRSQTHLTEAADLRNGEGQAQEGHTCCALSHGNKEARPGFFMPGFLGCRGFEGSVTKSTFRMSHCPHCQHCSREGLRFPFHKRGTSHNPVTSAATAYCPDLAPHPPNSDFRKRKITTNLVTAARHTQAPPIQTPERAVGSVSGREKMVTLYFRMLT